MVVIRGRLTPEAGAVVLKALTAAQEHAWQRSNEREDPPTAAQQQADALALIAETALHHGIDPGPAGERYQVVVHVDAPALADAADDGQSVLEDGQRVPAGTSRRIACDATRVVMQHAGDGRAVEVAARTRTIPPALRRALQYRDRGCRFPGCSLRSTQGHHIRHWADGGPTTLSNLASLCRRHHRAVHEEGYQVERDADGELRFRRPDGRSVPEVPDIPKPWSDKGEASAEKCVEALRHDEAKQKNIPKALIDDLLRQTRERRHEAGDETPDLFADFNGIPTGVDKTEFYQHDQNWSNRMILGDSLQVMASLAEREGLRGKVQR